MTTEPSYLAGKLLVAMPGIGDPRFDRAVVFMCAHSEEGALGLIVSQPAREIGFDELLDQLGIAANDACAAPAVHIGGPVEHGRGFVLHTVDYRNDDATLVVDDVFGMTATLDILRDIAIGRGPRAAILALGYAGWAPGQLEAEMQANGWLSCDADEAIVFEIDADRRWAAAMERIGIDPRLLSARGGKA